MPSPTRFARASVLILTGLLVNCSAVLPLHAADKKAAACSRPIPELYEQASPAVVSIVAQSINPYRLQGRVTQSLGSGFIIQEDGLILTNSHVVFGKQSLVVTLDDGSTVPARLVGADPIFDVALIQIPKPVKGTLPVLKLGDSASLREGEDVIAIGNPLGLDQTVTRGIVSGLNRLLQDTPFSLQEPLIQTDAPINPGNSGGPLLNRCGEVVGINAEIIPAAQNIGFAIPIDVAKQLMPGLIADGRVIRPWIGFHGQIIGKEWQKLLQLPLVEGLLVEVVEPGSPAEKAGLRSGDVIRKVDGDTINASGDLPPKIAAIAPGHEVTLDIWRKGAEKQIVVTVGDGTDGARSSTSKPDLSGEKLGVAVRPMTAGEKEQADVKTGLLVEEVDGAAARAGIRSGDIILSCNGMPVSSAGELRGMVAKSAKHVALLVQREKSRLFVVVNLD